MVPLTVILGLGNPGARYEATRHNLGFRVVDRLADSRALRLRAEGELGRRARFAETPGLLLVKPRTYMNLSGRAAAAVCRLYGTEASQTVLVYDDADLELGRLRLRPRGSAGGHRGVRSVIDALGTQEIPRVRLGVHGERRGRHDLESYVLQPFEPRERPIAEALVALAAEAVECIVSEGFDTAMNRYNGRRAAAGDDRPGETD